MISKTQIMDILNNPIMRVFAGLSKAIGYILYYLFAPLLRFFLKYWNDPRFCLISSCSVFVILLILYFTGFRYNLAELSLIDNLNQWRFDYPNDLSLWFTDKTGFHGFLPTLFATVVSILFFKIVPLFLAGCFAFGIVWAVFYVPKEKQQRQQKIIRKGKAFESAKINPKLFAKYRDTVPGMQLGIDVFSKKSVYIPHEDLNLHIQVKGPTGHGKTQALVLSMINYYARKNMPFIFLDGKGKLTTEKQIRAILRSHGREDDLMLFSLPDFKRSIHYNPFRNGDPTKLKDQFIGAQIWSEPFYKVTGESALQHIFNVFADQGITPTFKLLEVAFSNPGDLGFDEFKNPHIEQRFKNFCEQFKRNRNNFSGLAAQIDTISSSKFGHLFDNAEPNLDFMEAYKNNKIILIKLPTNSYHETAQRIGRLMIYDLMAVCSKIQTDYDEAIPKLFPFIIDEAGPFMCPAFEELLMKARDAGMGITYLHHSDGDMNKVDLSLNTSLGQNTNTKIVLGLDDGKSINDFCMSIGTEQTVKYTEEMMCSPFGGYVSTGRGSKREVDVFKLDPNEVRNLQPGEAIVTMKKGNRLHRVKLDFVSPDTGDIRIETPPSTPETDQPDLKSETDNSLSKSLKYKDLPFMRALIPVAKEP